MRIFKKLLFLVVLVLSIQIGAGTKVYAAEGKLYVAVSDTNVSVGNTVKVTLSARDSNNESAIADLEFTYDTNVFSFVSCDSDNYSGGEGGKVSATGSKVVITLKAIDQGSARITVTGSNGKSADSQQALDSMVAAGATIQAGGGESGSAGESESESTKSDDNSLADLSLSVGELSPEFSYSVTEYTATVPYETTEVEVNAQPAGEKAQIEAITGNSDLQVGENTVTVTVKAENGAQAVYTIKITRAAEGTQQPAESTDPESTQQGQTGTEETVDAALIEEYESKISLWEKEYGKLQEKYEALKSSSKKTTAILIFVIVVLVIVCVNLLIFRKNRNTEYDEYGAAEDFVKEKKERKTKSLFARKTVEDEEEWLDEEDEWLDDEGEEEVKPTKKQKKDIEIIDFDDF